LTLFKTGIIFSPRSLALWKTDIDWAWTPWLASTLGALSWGDGLCTGEKAYKKQSSLTCRKGSRDFPSEIDMTLQEVSDGYKTRQNVKGITGVSIKFKRCSRPWNSCNMLETSNSSVGPLQQKKQKRPADLAVWALTEEVLVRVLNIVWVKRTSNSSLTLYFELVENLFIFSGGLPLDCSRQLK